MSNDERVLVEVGQIVEFVGYDMLEGISPVLEVGQHIRIEKLGEDEEGNLAYSVRPVLEDGTLDDDKEGDQIFAGEFKIIVPSEKKAEKAKKKTAKKAKEVPVEAVEPDDENEEAAKFAAMDAANRVDPPQDEHGEELEISGDGEEYVPLITESGIEHDPIVAKLIRSSNDTTAVAYGLYVQHEELYFKLGGVLLELKENQIHLSDGYEYEDSAVGFAEFVKDHVGLERRHCYYLIKMYKRFRHVGISVADLAVIGWTQARMLLKIPEEELGEWLEKAKELTREELEKAIEDSQENITDEKISRRSYKFTLYGEAITLADQAMSHAKEQVDDDDSGSKAFEYMCTQYLILETDVLSENSEDKSVTENEDKESKERAWVTQ